jgi:glycosyltransferase involved in cell wall biosynthesis
LPAASSVPIKVMILAPWGTRFGGAERRLLTLLQRIDSTRVAAQVVFLVDGPLVQEVADAGIPVSVLPAGRLRNPRAFGRVVRALRRRLRQEPVDLLFSWGSKAQLYGGPSALGKPKLANAWWMLEVPTRTWLPMLATVLPAHAIACSSHYVATEQQRLLRPRRYTPVIHPGVREPRKVAAADVDALRTKLGIPPERLVVGVVGRMQPWKNHHMVLAAIEQLVRAGHDLHMVVVGGTAHGRSPGYEGELREQAARAGMSDRVSFVGHETDVDPYYALFDVFVLGSADEPFGLVVIESMASGVPTIAVDCAGPAEILEHEQTGWLVERADVALFAAAIARVADDPAARASIAADGRREYERRFTEMRMAQEFEEMLATIAAKQPRRRSAV